MERHRLIHALDRAEAWVFRHEDEFGRISSRDLEDTILFLKPFAEYVLTCRIMSKWSSTTRWGMALDRAWRRIGEGDLLLDLLLARPDLIVLACIFADFHCCGFRNSRLENLIFGIAETRAAKALELPRWRRIDLNYSLERIGGQELQASDVAGTWLEAQPDPWFFSNEVGYGITHVVFYLSDFGDKKERVLNETRTYLELWVPVWLSILQENRNWDLTAEFSMVADCLGLQLPRDPILDLLENQNTDGSVPGPRTAGEALVRPGDSAERIAFLSDYHTTLVSLMAFGMAGFFR